MGIRSSCYYEMVVVLFRCKNTVELLQVPAKCMCNLLMNGEMSADLISEAEHKGQSEKQGANNDDMSDL